MAIFALAAALAGLARFLFAHYIRHINYESFDLHSSILILCMVVLGGMGSLAGSVVGALALTAMPELFRQFKDYQDVAYGALLVALLAGLGVSYVLLRRIQRGASSRFAAWVRGAAGDGDATG